MQPNSRRVITRDKYDAVLLDLDGVITDTASLHAAWSRIGPFQIRTAGISR